MASFGKVLDLLDERYLHLQDVYGNVELLPTLVPYKYYTRNVLVYRMDTEHELFMALLHEFTARAAQQTQKELWTWFVQWDVDSSGLMQSNSAPSSSKKARFDVTPANTQLASQKAKRRAPIIDIFRRQVIPPSMTKHEDMLRILTDIVQVDSTLVPNFIEFLYRWIDYYEGDGTALKAALNWEIPSLWDFEYHPLVIPEEARRKVGNESPQTSLHTETGSGDEIEMDDDASRDKRTEELIQSSPTKKMREKPNLAAIERQTEESERLQYREVKYGIQPPELHLPIPPLINIPRDPVQRHKYYTACFKSRHRALVLLLDAGLTLEQISNYKKRQGPHPLQTSKDGDPDKLHGLRYYHKDARFAQESYRIKEKLQQMQEKQREIAMSNKLAMEAQLAEDQAVPGEKNGIPLIPPTPTYPPRKVTASALLDRLRKIEDREEEEKINIVPSSLVGRMRSKVFEEAISRQMLFQINNPPRQRTNAYVPSTRAAINPFEIPAMAQEPAGQNPSPSAHLSPADAMANAASSIERWLAESAAGRSLALPPLRPYPEALQNAIQGYNVNNSTANNASMAPYFSSTPPLHHLLNQSPVQLPSLWNPITQQTTRPASQWDPPQPIPRPMMNPFTIPEHTPQLPSQPTPPPLTVPQQFVPQIQVSSPHSQSTLTQPGPRIQRNAPFPLNLAPPTSSPLSSLPQSLLATSPFATSPEGMPVQLYFPRVVFPGNGIGPEGARMGNAGAIETDAILIGHAQPKSGKIVLSKALFLPVGVWENTVRRVSKGKYTFLETYSPDWENGKPLKRKDIRRAGDELPEDRVKTSHEIAYDILTAAYNIMRSSEDREAELTKRWRATTGPMTAKDRGAVWEGWGVTLDRGFEMDAQARKDAVVTNYLVDLGVESKKEVDPEEAAVWQEIEDMLEEDEREGEMEDEADDQMDLD